MPDSFVALFKRHARRRFGPHGLDPRYHGLYHKASQAVAAHLLKNGTPAELCQAIRDGVPVLEGGLSDLTADALDTARWTVRNELRDICDDDLLIVLDRIGKRAPKHHVVLASGPEWICPFCGGAHGEWTMEQLRRGIAFLQLEPSPDGTPGEGAPDR